MFRPSHPSIACCLFVTLASLGPARIEGSRDHLSKGGIADAASARSAASPPAVTLAAGRLEGVYLDDARRDVAFLGIPYAAPPVGELRWKPPRPAAAWSGVRKAAAYAASCPQLPVFWLPEGPWSEDCLFLNVWMSGGAAGAGRPVIVWLHGGSNTSGRSQQDAIGPALARDGVIIVGLNYRLGAFGFLAHAALTMESPHHASGNYGLLDQVQALRWVRENIARFGGDPRRVTVMGQSSGAFDACLLMASPLAAGLFERAILHSGDCQGTLIADRRASLRYNAITGSGEAAGERLARDLGVGGPSLPDTLRRLRALPASDILQAASGNPQDAIVDGWVVPEQPSAVFAAGRQLRIPVLAGSNREEAAIFRRGAVQTMADYKAWLEADTGRFAARQFDINPVASDAEAPDAFLRLLTDGFGYGAWAMARATARAGQRAYLYNFSYAETGTRAPLGAFHGLELQFLSDSFQDDGARTAAAAVLGTTMRAYWTRFARTGDPNGPGLPRWPNYDAGTDACLDLGATVSVRPTPRLAELRRYEQIMKEIFAETRNAAVGRRD
jgi:para-nitrobenzyl esterase